MKKIMVIMICAILAISCVGCANQEQETVNPVQEKTTQSNMEANKEKEESFEEKVQGYWMYTNKWGGYEYISFLNGKVSSGTYPGGGGGKGEIKSATKKSNSSYNVEIYYPEEIIFDETVPASRETVLASSNDEFGNSLVLKSGDEEFSYTYAGKTWEEFVAKCENTNESSGPSSVNNNTHHENLCLKCGRSCKGNYSYCEACRCSKDGCNQQTKRASFFCDSHACLMCGSGRTFTSSYCHIHKCYNCSNGVVEGSHYCIAHKCLMCDRGKLSNSQYCSMHD